MSWRSAKKDLMDEKARRDSAFDDSAYASRYDSEFAPTYTLSPMLAKKTPSGRAVFVWILMACGFGLVFAKAVYVQVLDNQFFQKQGNVRFARTLELPADRGRLYDRNGVVLASSIPMPSVWAAPQEYEADKAKLQRLAQLLEVPAGEAKELEARITSSEKNFVWLRRGVSEEVGQAVQALALPGVYVRKEFRRQYPEGEALVSVLGITNADDKGQEGLELAYNAQLTGKSGSRRVIKDRLGKLVEDVGEQVPARNGRDVTTSIDSKIQFQLYQKLRDAAEAHKAKTASAVVIDTSNGEILALANYPSTTPIQRPSKAQAGLMRNRVVADSFEPGSTIKPFSIALALESGRVNAQTAIQTAPGRMTLAGATITDAHPHGLLTVAEVLQKSSNVGTVKLALETPAEKMWEHYTELGFGSKPDLKFPALSSGRVRPHESWRTIEKATMSYGYGLSVSLLQLARAYTVFARDGQIIPLSLTKTEFGPQLPVPGVAVMDAKVAREVRGMLQLAAGVGGTAPKAQAPSYSVGGKTGTARKQEGNGYAENKYRSFFVGLAPINNPRLVVAVMMDEPSNGLYYGGDTAAPVFAQVVEHSLNQLGIASDLKVRPNVVAVAVEESN